MILLLALALTGAGEADSSEAATLEAIAYSADSLVFYPGTGDILLVGSSRIDYRDMFLEADTVSYASDIGLIRASGSPELFDRGESIRGTLMFYDMEARRGRIEEARSRYEFGLYGGSSITQVGRREFNIVDARFTTCESDTADYYFRAPRMKVFQDDRAIARPVYMYVADTPVFYFPYWVFPIRQGRQSGFTIPRFGQTARDGRYLRGLGYYFAFSDYLDLLLQGDILEESRFAVSASERHRLRYVHEGGVSAEWRREFETSRERWSIFGRHLHEFTDGTQVRLQAEFLSDRSYLEETQQQPEDRMTSEVRSWASAIRNFGRASVQLTLERTAYLKTDPDSIPDETESVQNLPDLRISIPSSPIFRTPSDPSARKPWHSLYWNLSAHYISTDTEREETRSTHSGLRTVSEVTSANRLLGILGISPRIGVTATVYDRDRLGSAAPWWLAGGASISLTTDVYGVFQTGALGYSAFRHSISPSAVLGWAPDGFLAGGADGGVTILDPDSAAARFYRFSDFSLPRGGGTIRFGLFQNLEAKRITSTGTTRDELLSLDLSTVLDLDPDSAGRSLSPLAATLSATPAQMISARADASFDLYSGALEELGLTTTLQISGNDRTLLPDTVPAQGMPWRLSLSHYYRLGTDGADDLSKLRASASLDLTPSWSIDYSAYYDMSDRSFINQYYTLRRDLHCWEAMFVRHISDTDSGFYFRINIKDLPDIKIEQHVSRF